LGEDAGLECASTECIEADLGSWLSLHVIEITAKVAGVINYGMTKTAQKFG
jgi:hypothetical protein